MEYVYWRDGSGVHMPRYVHFLPSLHRERYAVELRENDNLRSNTVCVYNTKDGWIWRRDWELLIVPECLPSPDPDGVWRYEYKGERYPLLARRVEWRVLEFEYLFR
jgi:hypothetical protein